MGAFAVALTTIALLPGSTEAQQSVTVNLACLLYTSDAADEL